MALNFIQPRFQNHSCQKFDKTLRQRVNEYFDSKGIDRYGNRQMVFKATLMLSLFFVPLLMMITGVVTNPWLVYACWLVMGLGNSGIGLCIMHDANHDVFSKKRWINKWMGKTLNLVGGNAEMWKIQHNVLHHTYTNIEGIDRDIDAPAFLRFSPHKKRLRIHRFQHLYAWFFYGLSTLPWVIVNDFVQFRDYNRQGLLKGNKTALLLKIIGWKIFYYATVLALPLIFVPVSPWVIIAGFVSMHFVLGFLLTIVFQTAHVMPTSEYPLPDDNNDLENGRSLHQLLTTANFAPKNRMLTWLIGGLNFQVEHHLLPNICHVHYEKLAPIVKKTAEEFGYPYYTHETFMSAIGQHARLLRELGKSEFVVTPVELFLLPRIKTT